MATIQELESFKLSDAVVFHDELNPNLWIGTHLDPKVRKQLMLIAEDFITTLGISDLHVKDITISGSNAAYSYTPHSDLDLHILVDMDKLPNNEVYRELFTAKKTLYNDQHTVTIRNVPVEVYVQDTNEPVKSLGEYSVVNDKWIKIPKKQRANFDQAATKAKYETLAELVDLAIKTADINRVKKLIDMIRRYRKAGLSKGGEFSPENLAYKAVRSQGAIDALYDLRNTLHGEELSIEEASSREDAIIKINKLKNTSGRTENEIVTINSIIDKLMKQFNIRPEEIGMSQRTPIPDYPKREPSAPDYPKREPSAPDYPKREPSAPDYPKREPVDRLRAKMAADQYEKMMAAAAMKDEWGKFLKRRGIVAESYTSKQQVIDHFVRSARKRGEDVNLAAQKGAGAWERGWRGPKPRQPKPYDPESYKNVRLPYVDEDGVEEDYDPNGPPPGPEFKPTMPKGTVRVDVSDVYDWYKLGQHISNMKGLGKHDFGKGPPSTILSFGDEDTEHKYIQDLEKTGLTTTDIDPVDPNQPKGMKRQKTDPTFNVNETKDKKAAVLKIQKHLNKKYGANLDLDGKLGPLTLQSINKFMPKAKTGLADEPNKTTAVQGKKVKVDEEITDLRVNKNPSPEDLYRLTQRSAHKHMRGIYHKGDTYWWDANDAIHKQGSDYLGIPYDYLSRMEAASDSVRDYYRVAGDNNVPDKIIKKYDIDTEQDIAESDATDIGEKIKNSLGLQQFYVFERGDTIEVSSLIVGKENQGKGLGSKAMKQLIDYADSNNKRITLTPGSKDKTHGTTSRARLVQFYKSLGFKESKGRNLDYAIGAGKMYRDPKSSMSHAVTNEASGYIPSEKEKNDPRFKTALTVDVGPDAIKKNAKAFGFKTSRAGIPPQARADGKIK